MITGCVYVDLTADDDHRDRHQLHRLDRAPDGARVVVEIGARRYVTVDAAYWLHQHAERLVIEVRGNDPETVGLFVASARTGVLEVL